MKAEVRGMREARARIEITGKKVQDQFMATVEAEAKLFVMRAKADCPKDFGESGLSGSITYDRLSNGVELVAGKFYAPYVEFGTKSRFQPSSYLSGISELAQKFRGKRVSFSNISSFEAIYSWAKRKGIGALRTPKGRISKSKASMKKIKSTAFLIWRSIMKHGIKPHPFFFPNVEVMKTNLDEMIKRISP